MAPSTFACGGWLGQAMLLLLASHTVCSLPMDPMGYNQDRNRNGGFGSNGLVPSNVEAPPTFVPAPHAQALPAGFQGYSYSPSNAAPSSIMTQNSPYLDNGASYPVGQPPYYPAGQLLQNTPPAGISSTNVAYSQQPPMTIDASLKQRQARRAYQLSQGDQRVNDLASLPKLQHWRLSTDGQTMISAFSDAVQQPAPPSNSGPNDPWRPMDPALGPQHANWPVFPGPPEKPIDPSHHDGSRPVHPAYAQQSEGGWNPHQSGHGGHAALAGKEYIQLPYPRPSLGQATSHLPVTMPHLPPYFHG
ncbi:hypothetical protein CXG81DRAFT_17979 [Caulochytrium protostelioides]|uniref:Uncharacterized protein n=1 Tax=Caulochytrium protostelioides TaxID=1555241 RepID=A0A4P9XB34_9FUNG|nr:hypothetical protein CXG81DRAFT_17979 [Caulochytrium protostelioides]|eukprot:RKP02311.1 hypothetical protein CXG81DRAFT_17979 [Caulochytrium protostelioides]